MTPEDLLKRNAAWAQAAAAQDPEVFARLAAGQAPEGLWIGCVDSRAGPELWAQLAPGEVLVHRNVAARVDPGDAALAATVAFAVEALRVRWIAVVGHTGCGGLRAARDGATVPEPVAAWVAPLRPPPAEADEPEDRLVARHTLRQAAQLARFPAVQAAWAAGRPLTLHAWVQDLASGRLRELGFRPTSLAEVEPALAQALARL